MREDIHKRVFVEGVVEKTVTSAVEAYEVCIKMVIPSSLLPRKFTTLLLYFNTCSGNVRYRSCVIFCF